MNATNRELYKNSSEFETNNSVQILTWSPARPDLEVGSFLPESFPEPYLPPLPPLPLPPG
jgi:hypothetical protein